MKITRAMGVPVLFGVTLLGSGCAATDEIAELRGLVSEVKATAANAQSAAAEAVQAAAEARRTAMAADQKAAEALRGAQAAQSCCTANTERMNRMFKKMTEK